jgi:hypothetical protein
VPNVSQAAQYQFRTIANIAASMCLLILPIGLIAAIPLINDRYQGKPIALALLQR